VQACDGVAEPLPERVSACDPVRLAVEDLVWVCEPVGVREGVREDDRVSVDDGERVRDAVPLWLGESD
jgi:hypothetical protein